MTQYTSPLCSCITCKRCFSAKGIHSHYHTAHTNKGNSRVRQTKGYLKDSSIRKIRAKQIRIDYLKYPNTCTSCNAFLDFKSRKNKFCSRSCAAKVNNAIRDHYTHIRQSITLKKTLKEKPKFSSVKPSKEPCKECSKLFWISKQNPNCKSYIYCSKECSKLSRSKQASKHFKKLGAGGARPSKRINYKGILLDSTFEVKLAIALDSLSIKWSKSRKFKYTKPNGKTSTYTPDFYLIYYNLYLDPKNNFLIHNKNPGNNLKDVDKIAFVSCQHNISIVIIDELNIHVDFITRLLSLVGQEGFEPSVILSCKDSGFDHSHHCPIVYLLSTT